MQLKKPKLWFFFVLALLLAFSKRNPGVNEQSRFALTQAIVYDQTLSIDPYLELPKNVDWSFRDGHYYPNKPPGVSFLGVPALAVISGVERILGKDPKSLTAWNFHLTHLFATSLMALLGLFWFLNWAYALDEKRISLSLPREVSSETAAAVWFLGTIMLPFSTTLFGHATTAAFLVGALYELTSRKRMVRAGFLLGWAMLCEYLVALIIPLALVWILIEERKDLRQSVRSLFQLALGALFPAVLFLTYHDAAFGGAFTIANKFQNPLFTMPAENHLIYGMIEAPSLQVLFEITLGMKRGLFLISPVLLFSLWGFYRWLKTPELRHHAGLALGCVAVFFGFNISFFGWHGGACSGPRYLIPSLSFLALSLLWLPRLSEGMKKIWKVALVLSLTHTAAIFTAGLLAPEDKNLLTEVVYEPIFRLPVQLLHFVINLGLVFLAYRLLMAHASQRRNQAAMSDSNSPMKRI